MMGATRDRRPMTPPTPSILPIPLIQLLQSPERSVRYELDEHLPDLDSLTPVQGWVHVKHRTNYLEVSTEAKTIVTLTCNRCLCQYNHRIDLTLEEVIWLDALEDSLADLLDTDIEEGDLVEKLPPDGDFDSLQWVYEQLCLALPSQQLCREDCPGIDIKDSNPPPPKDKRWAALEQLKQQLGQ
jgi:uncharacterized protein